MTPYDIAVRKLIHTHIDIINWRFGILLSKDIEILTIGKNSHTGDIRYHIDVKTGNSLLRIYYYNTKPSMALYPEQEQYLSNNNDIGSMYVIHTSFLPKDMYKTILIIIDKIKSLGGEYTVFSNGDILVSANPPPIETFLSDHFSNIFTDEYGNPVIVNL